MPIRQASLLDLDCRYKFYWTHSVKLVDLENGNY